MILIGLNKPPRTPRPPRETSFLAPLAVLAVQLLLSAPPCLAQECIGDCDGSGGVSIDELVRGVNIALGRDEVAGCAAFDRNASGDVTVDELVGGVQGALSGCAGAPDRLAFVIATDFQTGSFATIGLDPPRPLEPVDRNRRVNSDATVRTFSGLVYVVNRLLGDSIQMLDPVRDLATVYDCSVGSGANPHDIAFAGANKAYVTRYELTELLIVDPSVGPDCGGFVLGSIDLSAFADADGIPEMDRMLVVGGRLYVITQRLDRNNFFAPAGNGMLAVIDMARDEVVDTITLSGANPFAVSDGRDGTLIVIETGRFTTLDGGLERVDLASGQAAGFFVTESNLGGDITDAVIISDQLGYAVLSDEEFRNSVVAFNPRTGAPGGTLVSGSNFVSDLELNDRGELYVADRSAERPGVRVFRTADGSELTAAPLDVGLPPFEIIFLK